MNTRNYFTLVVGLLIFLMMACSPKLAEINSRLEADVTSDAYYSGYDNDTKLRWLASNDKTHLYLRLETEDRATKMKILMGGLQVFLDTSGRKNEGLYLHFPLAGSNQSPPPQGLNTESNKPNESSFQEMILNELNKHAVLANAGQEYRFNPGLDSATIKASLATEGNSLLYYAAIPFSQICERGLIGIEKFSIGIVGDAIEMPQNKSNTENRPPARNNGGQRPAGGMGGGGQRDPMNEGSNANSKPINIWFSVNLIEQY